MSSSSKGHLDLERALLVRMVQAIKPSRAAVLAGAEPKVSVAHGMDKDGDLNDELISKVVRTGGPVMENNADGSQLGVPFKDPAGGVGGVMYVELAPPRRLKNRDLAILQGLGKQVEEKLGALNSSSQPESEERIQSAEGFSEAVAEAAIASMSKISEELEPERGAIFVEIDGEPRVLCALELPLEDFLSKAPVSMPLLEHIWTRGRPVFIEDARNEIEYREFEGVVRSRIRSVAACPIKSSDGETRGLVYLDSRNKAGHFSATTLTVLEGLTRDLQRGLGELFPDQDDNTNVSTGDRTDAAIEMVLSLSAELGDLIDDSQHNEEREQADFSDATESLVDAELALPDLPDIVETDDFSLKPLPESAFDNDDEYALPDVLPVDDDPPSVAAEAPEATDVEDSQTEATEADPVPEDEQEQELSSDVEQPEESESPPSEPRPSLTQPEKESKPSFAPVFTKKRLLTRPRLRRPLSKPLSTDEIDEFASLRESRATGDLHDRPELRLQRNPESLWKSAPYEAASPDRVGELASLMSAPSTELYESIPTSEAPQVETKKKSRFTSPWPERTKDSEAPVPKLEKPSKRRRGRRPLGAMDFEELSRLEKLEKASDTKKDVAWAFESVGVSPESESQAPEEPADDPQALFPTEDEEEPTPKAEPVHTTGELFLYPPEEEPPPQPRPVNETTGELFLYPPGEEPEAIPRPVKETTSELFYIPPGSDAGTTEELTSEQLPEEVEEVIEDELEAENTIGVAGPYAPPAEEDREASEDSEPEDPFDIADELEVQHAEIQEEDICEEALEAQFVEDHADALFEEAPDSEVPSEAAAEDQVDEIESESEAIELEVGQDADFADGTVEDQSTQVDDFESESEGQAEPEFARADESEDEAEPEVAQSDDSESGPEDETEPEVAGIDDSESESEDEAETEVAQVDDSERESEDEAETEVAQVDDSEDETEPEVAEIDDSESESEDEAEPEVAQVDDFESESDDEAEPEVARVEESEPDDQAEPYLEVAEEEPETSEGESSEADPSLELESGPVLEIVSGEQETPGSQEAPLESVDRGADRLELAAEEAEELVTTVTLDPPPEREYEIELEEPEATLEDEIPAVPPVAPEPASKGEEFNLLTEAAIDATVQISPEDAEKVLAAIEVMKEQEAQAEAERPSPPVEVEPSPPASDPEGVEFQPEARPTQAPQTDLPAPPPQPAPPAPSLWNRILNALWPGRQKQVDSEPGLTSLAVSGKVVVEGPKVGESPVEVTLVFPTHHMRVVLELPPEGQQFRYHGSFPGENPTHIHLTVRKSGFSPVKLSNVRIVSIDGKLQGHVADITLLPLPSRER